MATIRDIEWVNNLEISNRAKHCIAAMAASKGHFINKVDFTLQFAKFISLAEWKRLEGCGKVTAKEIWKALHEEEDQVPNTRLADKFVDQMTDLDKIALQAMLAIIASPNPLSGNRNKTPSIVSEAAYNFAVAFLVERGRR